MKLKIIQEGWLNYNGPLNGVMFVDGVSEECTANQAARISAVIQVETEEGANPSPAQDILNWKNVAMDTQMVRDGETGKLTDEKNLVTVVSHLMAPVYSEEQLQAIADEKGIAGLREIADPMGIKGTSIAKLIEEIRKAQPASGVVAGADPVKNADDRVGGSDTQDKDWSKDGEAKTFVAQ